MGKRKKIITFVFSNGKKKGSGLFVLFSAIIVHTVDVRRNFSFQKLIIIHFYVNSSKKHKEKNKNETETGFLVRLGMI